MIPPELFSLIQNDLQIVEGVSTKRMLVCSSPSTIGISQSSAPTISSLRLAITSSSVFTNSSYLAAHRGKKPDTELHSPSADTYWRELPFSRSSALHRASEGHLIFAYLADHLVGLVRVFFSEPYGRVNGTVGDSNISFAFLEFLLGRVGYLLA